MATPTITYDELPPASLPLNGSETVTFEQNGVTVKANLEDIFANVAGVNVIGPLQFLAEPDGDPIGDVSARGGDSGSSLKVESINEDHRSSLTVSDGHATLGVSSDSSGNAFLDVSNDGIASNGNLSLSVGDDDNLNVRVAFNYFDGLHMAAANFASGNQAVGVIDVHHYEIDLSLTDSDGNQHVLRFHPEGTLTLDDRLVATAEPVTTVNRPDAAAVGAGYSVYDTDLEKPIYSNGTLWKDAVGAIV